MTMQSLKFIVSCLFLLFTVTYAYPQPQMKPPRPGMAPSGIQPSGPFNDETWGAVSDNGLTFEILTGPFFKKASVPDVLGLSKDGPCGKGSTLLLYFVDFSNVTGPGTETISLAASNDGINWSEKQLIIIEGKTNKGAAVDPSVVELPDGRIRLYFFGSDVTSGDPAKQEGDHKIYSAISSDGINFKVEGVNFQTPSITDPEVVQVGDEWLMFLSRGRETLLARSNDGLNFTLDQNFSLQIGGVPGAVVLPDGKVRVFACAGGIVSATFDPKSNQPPIKDSGIRIQEQGTIVADPAPIMRRDGSYYLIFKKNTPGQKPKIR